MHPTAPRDPCVKLSYVGIRPGLIATLTAAALIAGCGSTAPSHSAAPSSAQLQSAFKNSPPPLAGIHAQADQLLRGGTAAFRARLAALRGYPVVVNKWASWCGPCQSEFPVFQKVAVSLGRRVAFLGIDANDGTGQTGAGFLRRFPVTYPSFTDPQSALAGAVGASTYFPQTLFFSRGNHHSYVFDHAGPYQSAAALTQDIERYVLR